MNTATLPAGMTAKASHLVTATTIPSQVSAAQLQAAIAVNEAEQAGINTAVDVGLFGGNLAGMANPATGALNIAQKQMVQGAIIEVAGQTGQQIPTRFAEQLVRENAGAAIKDATKAAIAETGKKAGKEAINAAIQESAEALAKETAANAGKASLRETAKGMGQQAAKIATTKLGMEAANNVATDVATSALAEAGTTEVAKAGAKSTLASAVPVIGAVASAGVAIGGAAWEQHKADKELIKIYAKDLNDTLGVDPTKATVDDLKKLVETDAGKYDALKQELGKEIILSASVGAGGGIGGGAAGTVAGTVAGGAIAAGVTAVTGGAGIVAAPVIVKVCAFGGGVAGSMVGSNSVQTFYKNITGQDKETCIDAMRKLDAKVQAGEQVDALSVVRVIVGNDKQFDEACQTVSKDGKKLNELPAKEQVHLVMKQFPNLHHSATFLADEINKGELTDLTDLTRLNTQAINTYGVDYVEKAVAANNAVPFNRISSQSVSAEPMLEDGKKLGTGVAGEMIAARAAQQNVGQSVARA